jgi:phosphatidylglycerol---prolipoprotein diacylglyceryl transferase
MSHFSKIERKELDSLLIYVFFGVILWGRLGYVLLYDFSYFTGHPRAIFEIWKGGMSFHGGLMGVIIAIFLFSKKYQKAFFSITDPLGVIIPVAIGLGRIGNYINNELPWYSPYSWPFPMIVGWVKHFPSPLLEMILEWMVLFIVMCFVAKNLWYFQKTRSFSEIRGLLSWVFLIGYGTARMISEFFRLPDGHIGYLLGTDWLTLGMIYTLPLIFFWMILVIPQWGERVSPEGKIR